MRPPARAFALLAALAAAACGDSAPGPDATTVRFVIIRRPDGAVADTVERVQRFGAFPFQLQAFNAAGVQLTRDRYIERWESSDVRVAAVAGDGLATVLGDGRTLLVARADAAADTVALEVAQVAVAVRAEQDTLVALAPGAVRIGQGAAVAAPARLTLVRVDARGSTAPSSEAIAVTNLDPGRIGIETLAGDTVLVTGLAEGDASIGLAFGAFRDTVAVHVVSRYAVIGVAVSPGEGTVLLPASVTIPAGAGVLFQNFETGRSGAQGAGWRVGPVAGRSYEGQRFDNPGTYAFTAGSANGSVVVTP